MAKVELRDVRKSYGATRGDPRRRRRRRRRRVHRHRRAVGLRQVDAAAHGRGARGDHRRARSSIGDRVVNTLEPKDRDIAMVFQNYALYPHMSVFDNMAYGLKIRGFAKDDIEARVEARRRDPRARAAARAQAARSSRAASGSASRWAARSCASRRCSCSTSRCRTSTPSCACRCASRSRSCTGGSATTSLYVTHDQVEAMTLAQRMIVMNAGRAEQIGTPMEVYENPATLFVAGFIGSPAMNFLPAKADGGGAHRAAGTAAASRTRRSAAPRRAAR